MAKCNFVCLTSRKTSPRLQPRQPGWEIRYAYIERCVDEFSSGYSAFGYSVASHLTSRLKE